MPFVAPTNFDEENEKKKQDGSGAVNVSGESSSFATNVPGQEGAGKSAAPQKSSGQYTNIQSYLDANKTQADQMGQKITDDVSSQAEDANSKINSYQNQQIKAEAYDPNEAINRATELQDAEKAKYKEVKQTGGYAGPQSVDQVQGYQETQQAAQKASQNVKNAGNEFGQQQLLKDTYSKPTYSAGQNKLDQVLLANSAGSKQNLQGLSQKYAGIDQALSGANQKVGDLINSANAQAQAQKQAFVSAEDEARNALLNPINRRVEDANLNNPALINRITNDVRDYNLTKESMDLLGLNEGMELYDSQIGNYLNLDGRAATYDNMANADERKRYTALQSLFDDPSMQQITADGTAINPVGMDRAKFDEDTKKAAETGVYANQTLRRAIEGTRYGNPEQAQALVDQRGGMGFVKPIAQYNRQDAAKVKSVMDSVYGKGQVRSGKSAEVSAALKAAGLWNPEGYRGMPGGFSDLMHPLDFFFMLDRGSSSKQVGKEA